ncbi:hypothetical protein CEXT_144461 [Caerostris extrusa]|uniref:Uncharacterized protein n=1 Tax=Caerostris extrusa TaxID=172846 RepID=A0AAV4XBV3_CAEEX|nr:hypothetical protein CEXT_144461 [Caerostris extrusa]
MRYFLRFEIFIDLEVVLNKVRPQLLTDLASEAEIPKYISFKSPKDQVCFAKIFMEGGFEDIDSRKGFQKLFLSRAVRFLFVSCLRVRYMWVCEIYWLKH